MVLEVNLRTNDLVSRADEDRVASFENGILNKMLSRDIF